MLFDLSPDLATPRLFKGLGAKWYIRPLWPAKLREIRVEMDLPAYPEPKERLSDEQQAEFVQRSLDHVLADWRDVAINGDPVPCNPENRALIVDNHEAVNLAIGKWAEQAYVLALRGVAHEASNSPSSSNTADEQDTTQDDAVTAKADQTAAASVSNTTV